LDAGGDLLAAGTGPDGTGWKIGVEDPHQPDRLAAALLLPTGGAVCTSSIARRRWQHEGRMVHHLLDPRTGQPGGAGLWSVTVVGPDAAWAEVWSKTLFLTGVDAIARAAVGRPVVWVRDDGRLGLTPEAERLVFWRHGSREGRPMPAPGLPSPLLTPPPAVLPPAWRLG
jgi:thiamine biosynthesis lipoprotein